MKVIGFVLCVLIFITGIVLVVVDVNDTPHYTASGDLCLTLTEFDEFKKEFATNAIYPGHSYKELNILDYGGDIVLVSFYGLDVKEGFSYGKVTMDMREGSLLGIVQGLMVVGGFLIGLVLALIIEWEDIFENT